MQEYNFVNDEIFAKSFVKSKTKNNGKKKVLMHLKMLGVDEEIAKTCVENFSNDEENILSVAKKYLKGKTLDIKTQR